MNYFRATYFSVTHYIIDALFPPQCIPCGKKLARDTPTHTLCAECFAKIPSRTGFICGVCGARQPTIHNECHKSALIIAAATDYSNNEVRTLIHALKYTRVRGGAPSLAALLARFLTSHPLFYEHAHLLIIPVPLHPAKERVRGYNQSLLIAKELMQHFPDRFLIAPHLLRRTHNTPSQTAQRSHADRARNVKDAFVVKDKDALRGRIVFLLDDVSTSGATLREAAATLRHAGARHVIGLAVAKA